MGKGKLVKWIGKVSDYRNFYGFQAPTHIEALWKLDKGDFQYVDFYVTSIKYDY